MSMFANLFGELAALCTAASWGFSSQVQGMATRIVGANGVALLRQPYQLFFLTLFCLGMQADTAMNAEGFLYLAASGIVGLCGSDLLFYRCVTILGPSVAVLLIATSTVFSTLFGWLFLQETMSLQAVGGIAVVMLGVLIVLTEHGGSMLLPGQEPPQGRTLHRGIAMGLIAAVFLGASFLLLKMGLRTGVAPLWGSYVRLLCGMVPLWLMGWFGGWISALWRDVRRAPKVCGMIFLSSSVSALGMWMAGVAVHHAPVGVATTLFGLQPVAVTILSAIWFRKMPSLRLIGGIAVAFAGTAMVCLR